MDKTDDREVQRQPRCCTLLFFRDNEQSSKKRLAWRQKLFCKQVGAKIAYYRTLLELSQDALAKKANIGTSVLRRIERGRYRDDLSLLLLLDIAEGLRIDVSFLVSFTDP